MDMLVKLVRAASSRDVFERLGKAGITTRRALAPEKHTVVAWVRQNFSEALGQRSRCRVFPAAGLLLHRHQAKDHSGICLPRRDLPATSSGPTGVDPNERKHGIGKALLFNCLEAMKQQGYGYAIIGGVGPAEFYAKTVGAIPIEGSEPGIYRGLL